MGGKSAAAARACASDSEVRHQVVVTAPAMGRQRTGSLTIRAWNFSKRAGRRRLHRRWFACTEGAWASASIQRGLARRRLRPPDLTPVGAAGDARWRGCARPKHVSSFRILCDSGGIDQLAKGKPSGLHAASSTLVTRCINTQQRRSHERHHRRLSRHLAPVSARRMKAACGRPQRNTVSGEM